MKNAIMPIPVDGELKGLIKEAAQKTHLSQADVMRSALRIGLPQVVARMEVRRGRSPEEAVASLMALGEVLRNFKRNRELVKPSRFIK
jgi:hypothetical protein